MVSSNRSDANTDPIAASEAYTAKYPNCSGEKNLDSSGLSNNAIARATELPLSTVRTFLEKSLLSIFTFSGLRRAELRVRTCAARHEPGEI